MRTIVALAGAALIAASSGAAPTIASAQPYRDYGRGDICHHERQAAASRGSVLGAILGGVFGAGVAGGHDRAAGAIIGGSVGAVAGHEIGRGSVNCMEYPRRIEWHRDTCHWVREFYDGAEHEFEVCRDSDGVWRPSGRS